MGKIGDALGNISGQDALKGFSAAFGGLSGLQGNGLDGAMGGLSGLMGNEGSMGGMSMMQLLFDKLGIFGKKKEEVSAPAPQLPPSGTVGPRY